MKKSLLVCGLISLILLMSATPAVADDETTKPAHSSYRFLMELPETVNAGRYVNVPVTISTEQLGEAGYGSAYIEIEKSSGPGNVLVERMGENGKVTSYLNTGRTDPMKIDSQYSRTEPWILKFSQPGSLC